MDDLIFRYLNEETSPDEERQIIAWVKASDENAQEFARACSLHSQLRMELQGLEQEATDVELEQDDGEVGKATVMGFTLRRVAKLAALAACVAILLTVVLRPDGVRVARLEQAVDVEWVGDAIAPDALLEPQTLQLASGIVRLLFDNGVEVTIEGPAEYEIVSATRTVLHTGILAAYVPPGAEGFTVETPSLEVVDLGTSFGIQVSQKAVDVSVFEGEVQINSSATNARERLTEGASLRMRDGNLETVAMDVEPFKRLWPVASGIAESSDNFSFAPPWPRAMRLRQSDNHIHVYVERRAAPLKLALQVNACEPGKYPDSERAAAVTIEAGTVIRSYLLQFNPETPGPGEMRFRSISGDIRFADPVIGLIFETDELNASDRLTPFPAPAWPEGRGLEAAVRGGCGDVAELSQDRHTLRLRFHAMDVYWDQIRVIVAPQPSD